MTEPYRPANGMEGAQPLWSGEVAALQAENAGLREALKPFFRMAEVVMSYEKFRTDSGLKPATSASQALPIEAWRALAALAKGPGHG